MQTVVSLNKWLQDMAVLIVQMHINLFFMQN